jgi:hypothetical protein
MQATQFSSEIDSLLAQKLLMKTELLPTQKSST